MKRIKSTEQLFRDNIIGVKVENQSRNYRQTLGGTITKQINRTKYIKLCWMCGSLYQSNKYNSYACSSRCSHNINYALKKGLNPPMKMDVLTKERNVRGII